MSNEALGAFLLALSRPDNDVTQDEAVRFEELTEEAREIVQTASIRITTRIKSIDQAQRDYTKMEQEYLASCMDDAEDPDDDFETGYGKAVHSRLVDKFYKAAVDRYNFELRDSAKVGITPARSY